MRLALPGVPAFYLSGDFNWIWVRGVWGSFVRQRMLADELIYAEIHRRRDDPSLFGEDILSLMMTACDQAGQSMTDAELRDELITLLVAGYDTTTTALTWALYWIHYLPQVHKKLLAELDSLGFEPEPTAIAKLPYLNAVCSETLRIYPVALFAFSRIVQAPIQIMGHQFESGTLLNPCIYLTHQREDLYPNTSRLRNSKQSFLTEFQEFQLCHLLKIGRETGLTERY